MLKSARFLNIDTQVNDDLSLESNGWTSLFVDKLREMDDFGVAGPTDPMWGGRLLTQAFVSRTHYTIFGRFYPLDIRVGMHLFCRPRNTFIHAHLAQDWYSDNWMTEVYGDANTYKFSSVRARNVNDKGTRYNPCDKPKYGTVMAESQAMLEDYRTVKRVEAKSREMGVVIEGEGGGAAEGGGGSKGKLVLEARLQRALARGSLLQR